MLFPVHEKPLPFSPHLTWLTLTHALQQYICPLPWGLLDYWFALCMCLFIEVLATFYWNDRSSSVPPYQNMGSFLEGRNCSLVSSVSLGLGQGATDTISFKLCYLVVAQLLPLSFSTFLILQITGLPNCKLYMKLFVLPLRIKWPTGYKCGIKTWKHFSMLIFSIITPLWHLHLTLRWCPLPPDDKQKPPEKSSILNQTKQMK